MGWISLSILGNYIATKLTDITSFFFQSFFSLAYEAYTVQNYAAIISSTNTPYPILYHGCCLNICSQYTLLFQRAPYRIAHYSGCCSLGWFNHIRLFRAVYLLQSWWLSYFTSQFVWMGVCKCLTEALVESSRLVNNFPVELRCRVVWMWGGRPGQISPLHWHSAGLKLWAALFSRLRGSPERTVGLAEAPREAQRVFHLQQLFRQAHPQTASEFQTPTKYGRRLPTNLLMKFCMADRGRYISSKILLLGADLILYLEIC